MRFHAYALIIGIAISCLAHADAYQSVQIVSPGPEETVHDNNGDVGVTVTMAPQLRAGTGDHLVLLLDDKVAAAGPVAVFQLNGIDRGSHKLQVRIEAASGAILATSPPVTFYMWRASRLFRKAP